MQRSRGTCWELGVVESFARPGGNVTGQVIRDSELAGKRLEWLKSVVPALSQVGWLTQPGVVESDRVVSRIEAFARQLGLRLTRVEADTPEAIDAALAAIKRSRVDALLVQDSFLFYAQRDRIQAFARQHRLPTVCGARAHAEAGCLIAYGPDTDEMWWRAAAFVDKILKGSKPAALPVEFPHKLDLVVNERTAKLLGVALSPTLLSLANEVVR